MKSYQLYNSRVDLFMTNGNILRGEGLNSGEIFLVSSNCASSERTSCWEVIFIANSFSNMSAIILT